MKIIVTGGAGFIGSALVRHLIASTDHEIIVVDKLTYAGNLQSISMCNESENFHLEIADICDNQKIQNIFNKYNPNIVMHLAAESHVDRSIDGPTDFINTNILGTFNLLERSREFYESLDDNDKSLFKFHHISTDEVYGDLEFTSLLFTESTAYDPSSPYSATKASSDHLVRAWGRTYGLPITISNCSNNYGPYHFPEKLIPRVILNAIHGEILPIYGDGSQIRDWLYVEDHVKALVKIALDGEVGETYNIGGHNEKTNLEVIKMICNILEEVVPNKPKNLNYYHDLIEFVDDRPGHDQRYAIDATKIYNELNWVPIETFESGLKKTVDWYLDNQSWWKSILSGDYKHKG